MTGTQPVRREADLYAPIRDYLVAQGYTVRGEVRGCDITATREGDLVVIEMKRSLSVALLVQATQRQQLADSVYVAVPAPRQARDRGYVRGLRHLLRRLELGLIYVHFRADGAAVEVVSHPLPLRRRRDRRERRAVLREMAGRSGDHSEGGGNGRPVVTAYREAALYIAFCLGRRGPLAPRQLRALGGGAKTQSILAKDFYGWFERVERGVYRLRSAGEAALAQQPDLAAGFEERLARHVDGSAAQR